MNAIEFIKKRIAEGQCADWVPATGWDDAKCINTIDFLKVLLETTELTDDMQLVLSGENNHECNVHVIYKPDYDFDYISFEHCYHDGTLLFIMETIGKVARKPFGVQTYNKSIAPTAFDPEHSVFGYDYEYIIGDCAVLTEHGDFGTLDKPWLQAHTIVGMPISMRFMQKKS